MWLDFIVSMKWFLVIVVFIWYFKQQLSNILSALADKLRDVKSFESNLAKIKFFGPGLGSNLNPSPPDRVSKTNGAYNEISEGYNKGFGPFELQTVIEEGNIIEKQILERKGSEADTIGLLIYSLAHQNVRSRFLIFDRFITTAQISVLEYLNANILPVPNDRLNNFCDKLAGEEKGYTYDSFIGWMVDWKLIEQTSRGFIIAMHGRDYLSFRARAGSNSLKPVSKPWQKIASSLA